MSGVGNLVPGGLASQSSWVGGVHSKSCGVRGGVGTVSSLGCGSKAAGHGLQDCDSQRQQRPCESI